MEYPCATSKSPQVIGPCNHILIICPLDIKTEAIRSFVKDLGHVGVTLNTRGLSLDVRARCRGMPGQRQGYDPDRIVIKRDQDGPMASETRRPTSTQTRLHCARICES